VSEETVKGDLARLRDLRREEAIEAVEEHVQNLQALKRRAYELLDGTDSRSLNRSAILGVLRQIEMDIARLDGSLLGRVRDDVEGPKIVEIHHVPADHWFDDPLPPVVSPSESGADPPH